MRIGHGVELRHGRSVLGYADSVRLVQGPVDTGGKALLAHELTHTVQQRAGQSATFRLSGLDAGAARRLVPSQVKVLILSMKDAAGREFAISGPLRAAKSSGDVLQQEWEIVYEGIQRTL